MEMKEGIEAEVITFISKDDNANNLKSFGGLLTKEDLIQLDRDEPFWRRLRLVLFILFWVIWIGLLVASILIIINTKACPPQPKEQFWNSKVGYWLDPFAFKDSNGDLIGDFAGLTSTIDYIKNTIGAGYIILTPIFAGYFTNNNKKLGMINDFNSFDKALGTEKDLKNMLKSFKKEGLEVILSVQYSRVDLKSDIALMEKATDVVSVFAAKTLFSRDGKKLDPASVYGSLTGMADLRVDILDGYLKKTTKYWLDLGFNGILISDAAFYAADIAYTPTNTPTSWFSDYPAAQLYTDGGLKFIKSIRKYIDEYASAAGKTILLAVEEGDTGYGVNNNNNKTIISLLGTDTEPGAHLAISKQFVNNRGWKFSGAINDTSLSMSSIQETNDVHVMRKLAMSAASPSDSRHANVIDLAATFLLPSSPIIYYGTEFGLVLSSNSENSNDYLYPKGHEPLINISPLDTSLLCGLPMPWDQSGVRFSSNFTKTNEPNEFGEYLQQYNIIETVESAMAIGRPPKVFDMVTRLVKLRSEKTLRWGSVSSIFSSIGSTPESEHIEVFSRAAEGFSTFVIALLRNVPLGKNVDLTFICPKDINIVMVYPPNPYLPENSIRPTGNMFFSTMAATTPGSTVSYAVYVLKCV